MLKKVHLIIFSLLLLLGNAQARHIKGGWIYYECLGPSQTQPGLLTYKLSLKLYRDCAAPSSGQNPDVINFSIFQNSTNQQIANVSAPRSNEYILQKGSFSNCISPVPTICYTIFEFTTTVDLLPVPGGYSVSFQRCCRIDGIVNEQPPSNTEGITYTIKIPGTENNPTFAINSSPLFAERDTAVTCFNSNIVLDYSAIDPDGDSLVYAFAPALSGAGQGNPSPGIATAPPYNSVPYQSGYSFNNPFGTTININSHTGIITGTTPSITGEYVLAVSILEYRNGNVIAETRKELHVVVAGCTLVAAVLPPKIISCDDFSVSFENQALSPNIRTYHWDFGVLPINSDTSTLPTPTFIYPDTGLFTAKLIVNKFETCSDSATTQVIVYPGFKPGFRFVPSCIINPFQFFDTTKSRYGLVNKWSWDFGEPTISSDVASFKNPSYRYPTLGVKTVLLTVSDSKGCEDTITKTLNVLDKPPLGLAFKDTLICSIDTLQLIASGGGSFVWTPNFNIINANTATPLVYPKDSITYYVTVTDGACTNTDSVRINVLDSITVDAGTDTTICRTDSVLLKPVSFGLQYQWTPTATLNNANAKFPFAKPVAASTTYFVIANLGKCQAKDSVTVKTIPYPQANAGADTTICFNTTVVLRGSIVGASFNWSPRAILQNANLLTPTARPPGTTHFVLTVFDTLGCPKPFRDTVKISVLPKLNVFAGNDTSIIIGQPLVFNLPDVADASNYQWTPPTGLSNPNLLNTTALISNGLLPAGQDFILYTLKATTPFGCVGVDDVLVKVFKTAPTIFIPTAFTPNGDGNNDDIKPILAGFKQLDYFKIYNRLGQEVFNTTRQNHGWNGKIKGDLQASAAFVYAVQAVDFTGKMVKQTGTFVLIR